MTPCLLRSRLPRRISVCYVINRVTRNRLANGGRGDRLCLCLFAISIVSRVEGSLLFFVAFHPVGPAWVLTTSSLLRNAHAGGNCLEYVHALRANSKIQTLSPAGTGPQLLIVGCGGHEMIRRYKEMTDNPPFEILADPGKKLYTALSVTKRSTSMGDSKSLVSWGWVEWRRGLARRGEAGRGAREGEIDGRVSILRMTWIVRGAPFDSRRCPRAHPPSLHSPFLFLPSRPPPPTFSQATTRTAPSQ